MTGYTIVAIITAALSLFLALRAYRSHGLSFRSTAWMAAIWVVIIAVVAFIAGRMAG